MTDKNEQHELDGLFKDQLDDFKVPPMSVSHKADQTGEEMDQVFRQQFSDFEPTPAPHNWENIQDSLPLHLIWRRRLIRLSQAAAVLLFATLGSVLLTQGSSPFYDMVSQDQMPPVSPVEEVEALPVDTDNVYYVDQEQADYDRHENSRSVFSDDALARKQQKENQQRYLENNGDLQPLASSPIEELENGSLDSETLSGENVIESLKNPMRTPSTNVENDEVAKSTVGQETENSTAQ